MRIQISKRKPMETFFAMRLSTNITLCVAFLLILAIDSHAQDAKTRKVELTYSVSIEPPPDTVKTIDLWLPIAQDTDGQRVSSVNVNYPEGGNISTETKYGNNIWHKRFEAPFDDDLHDGELGAEIVFLMEHDEINVAEAKSLATLPKTTTPEELVVYLQENRLIPVQDEKVNALAKELGLESLPPIPAARKIFDWLISAFSYNFMVKGAGQGDVRWACDAKSGDCTDYSSTFIALCRNQGIPADHVFGFPIRNPKNEGRIPSYHCWARFYVEGAGWIPIDASESDKHPEQTEYNFGSLSAATFTFTHGRDVILVPPQAAPPLNKFIHPYVEVDGQEYEDLNYTVAYKNL